MKLKRGACVAACVALFGLVSVPGAQASNASVRAAIKGTAKQVKESPELKAALFELKVAPKTLAKLVTALRAFKSALRKAAQTVEAQHASTVAGKEGEADWLAGVRKVAHGFALLSAAITDIKHGHKHAAKAQVKAASVAVKAGSALDKKGQALLGLHG